MDDQALRLDNLRSQLVTANINTPVTVDLSPLVELVDELLMHHHALKEALL